MKPSITALMEAEDCQIHGRPGAWQKATCPFHEDAHASASIHEDYATFICHACNLNLDSYGFLMRLHNLTYPEARDHARRLGLDTETEGPSRADDSGLRGPAGRRSAGLPSRQGSRRQGNRFRPSWLRA